MTKTKSSSPIHLVGLNYRCNPVRAKLFAEVGNPWEGDDITWKFFLIHAMKLWSKLAAEVDGSCPPCPIRLTDAEVAECFRLNKKYATAGKQLEYIEHEILGLGPEGWVLADRYEDVVVARDELKERLLALTESEEEQAQTIEHSAFGDCDESEYDPGPNQSSIAKTHEAP